MKIYLLFLIFLISNTLLLSHNEFKLIISNSSDKDYYISYNPFDSTEEIITENDTILFMPKNNLFYIHNASDLMLVYNDLDSVISVNISSESISFAHNNHFCNFLNDYYLKFSRHIDSLSNESFDISRFEQSLYPLFNDTIFNFFSAHPLGEYFSVNSQFFFKRLMKYQYLEILLSFPFNEDLNSNIINQDTIVDSQLPFYKSIPNNFLDEKLFFKSTADSSFFNNLYFKKYIFNYCILKGVKLCRYNINNDEQNYIVSKKIFDYAEQYLNDELFQSFMFYYLESFSSILNSNTLEYYESMLVYFNYPQNLIDSVRSFVDNNKITIVNKSFIPKKTQYDFYLEDINGDISSLDNLSGKILYIDIWASWCGPCRKQFPYSNALKENMSKRQLRKIEFIYISIDNDNKKWKDAIESFNIEGLNFISPANQLDGAGTFFEVTGIPRYIIINKDGSIYDYNAKRPSSEALLNELIELINH